MQDVQLDPNDRAGRVLATLIREYISTGEPVPSATLAAAAGLNVSSATVRNILARLEAEGFVRQPHTSSGRVPTDRGYRFYVDLLLESRRTERSASLVEARLRRGGGTHIDTLLPEVTHVLSQTSKGVGFALRRAHDTAVFERVEFVPISRTRILVVVVARGGHVVQKVIDIADPMEPEELRESAAYLNAEFSGLPLKRARESVIARLKEERSLYDELVARAMRLASTTFSDFPGHPTVYIEGAATLLEELQGVNLSVLQTLLQMLDEKERLVHLLDEYIGGPGLTVVIGVEHLVPQMRPFTLIASTYDDESSSGSVGVIGPTRMRYSRTIAAVDGAAQAVSRALRRPN
jgi:heat-inducible transcriptional repressor